MGRVDVRAGKIGERTVSRTATLAAPALLAAAALLLSAAPGRAQDAGNRAAERAPSADLTEAPPPPRILEQERAKAQAPLHAAAQPGSEASSNGVSNPAVPRATPFQARLAPPTPGRDDDLDEIIVFGRNDGSHLPDLGSGLRAEQAAQRGRGRIQFTLLPLYEGSSVREERNVSLFGNRQMQRVGRIDLFRFSFGGRSKD